MKILSVKFSNLNSLREEVDIDFVDGPLGAAGLFAITGPTGSGKSTILDAISLALYGSTARNQKHEIISRGSKKAESTVEFELKGKRYRSTWSMRLSKPRTEGKSPTGTPSMELALVDQSKEGEDSILGEKVSQVPKLIEQLTGLNFSRFTQSMLLAQGQFDAFLVAPTKDRSDLLEQITGTQIYSDVSKLVYERHKELAVSLKARKEELDKRGVPDEDQIQKLTEEEVAKTTLVTAQTEPIKLLRVVHQAHQENTQVQLQKERLQREEVQFAEQANHRINVQAKLAAHRRAQPLVADLRSLELQRAEVEKVSLAYKQAEGLLPTLLSLAEEQKTFEASAKTQHKSAADALQKVQITVERLKDLEEVLAKSKKTKGDLEEAVLQQRTQKGKLLEKQTDLTTEQQRFANEKAKVSEQVKELASYVNLESKLPSLRNLQQGYLRDRQSAQQVEKAWGEVKEAGQKIESALADHVKDSPFEPGEDEEAVSALHETLPEVFADEIKSIEKILAWLRVFGVRLKAFLEDLSLFEQRKDAFLKQQVELTAKGVLLETAKQELTKADAKFKELVAAEKLSNEAFQAIKLTAELRATHIHKLVDDQPCPLCGALEHPVLNELSEVKPAAHEQAWIQAKNQVAAQQDVFESLSKNANQIQVEVAALTDVNTAKDLADQQEKTDRLKSSLWNELSEKELTGISLDDAGLSALRGKYKSASSKLESSRASYAKAQVLAKAVATYKQGLDTLKARESDQNQRAQKVQIDLKEAKQKLATSQQNLSLALTSTGLPIPESLPDDFVEKLQSRVDTLKQYQTQLQVLSTKEAATKKEAQGLVEQLDAIEKTLIASVAELQKQSASLAEKQVQQTALLAGFESADALLANSVQAFEKSEAVLTKVSGELTESNKKIETLTLQQTERTKRIEELTKEITSLSVSLEAAVKKREFDSVEQALASLLEESAQEALQSETDLAARTQTGLETRRKSIAESEASLALKLDKQPDARKVSEELTRLEQLLSSTQVALGGIQKELKRALEDRKAMERDAAAVAKQEDDLADWTTLNKLIGSATGSSFREYAQRITLHQLLAFANEYLKEFYPRFSVSSEDARNTDPLEIFICDHYEADHVRKVATVSGGERFLVSMALALGFSRMASRNISIDTLFIDEGFGTLDGETLDKAIQALEKLQQRGKTIGIISHVASLQERIGAQIRLVRQSSGRSKVEIIG